MQHQVHTGAQRQGASAFLQGFGPGSRQAQLLTLEDNQGFDVSQGCGLGKDGKKSKHKSLIGFSGRALGGPPHF